MNILILSSGRRTKLIQYFKENLKGIGSLILTDCSELAPSLYFGDQYYIVPPIHEQNYIDCIIDICKKENVKGIFSLIDPEIELISSKRALFESLGIKVFSPETQVADTCYDKYKLYEFCKKNNIKAVNTYNDINTFLADLKEGVIHFPVFLKPKHGSASMGIRIINKSDELERFWQKNNCEYIIQEYMTGQEYGVDTYTDILSKEIVSIFIKKKIVMRSGETDKAESVKIGKLFDIIQDFSMKLKLFGQSDIDVFEKDGEFLISEVNPRFGGGYPLAYECGCNFPQMIIRNLSGIENENATGHYDEGVFMMKWDDVSIRRNERPRNL